MTSSRARPSTCEDLGRPFKSLVDPLEVCATFDGRHGIFALTEPPVFQTAGVLVG